MKQDKKPFRRVIRDCPYQSNTKCISITEKVNPLICEKCLKVIYHEL